MTVRSDIEPDAAGWRRLSYTCRCGWVDWGHAKPEGALGLKKQLDTGHSSWTFLDNMTIQLNNRAAFVVVYGQGMGRAGIRVSTDRHWIVAKGLSDWQREQVGLGIFMSASQTFEKLQGSFPFSIVSGNSSFSVEDLVSNLIGFYIAFRGSSQDAMRSLCGEVSVQASYDVWDASVPNGLQTYRNTGYQPILFPCQECANADKSFPTELSQLKAARQGDLYVAPEGRFLPGNLVNTGASLKFDSQGRFVR